MAVDRVVKLSQVSGLLSVQLLPNRVCEDYSYDTLDVFPLFQVSLETGGYFPDTSPSSLDTLAHGSLPPEATGSLNSFVGSLAMSLSLTGHTADLSLLPNIRRTCLYCRTYGGLVSIAGHTADLSLLTDPLISIPDEMLLLPMRPQWSPGRQSPGELLTSVDSSLLDVSCEGPFDAYCELSDTGNHPLISTGLPICPYRMTSYRVEEVADVDPAFWSSTRKVSHSAVWTCFCVLQKSLEYAQFALL